MLIAHLYIPCHDALANAEHILAVAVDFALAREARADRVADADCLDKAQIIEPIVGQQLARCRRPSLIAP